MFELKEKICKESIKSFDLRKVQVMEVQVIESFLLEFNKKFSLFMQNISSYRDSSYIESTELSLKQFYHDNTGIQSIIPTSILSLLIS